jgi:hypothetical protein
MDHLTRRQLVGGFARLAVVGAAMSNSVMASTGRQVGPRPIGRPAADIENPISLTMTFANGSTRTYSERAAVDLGPYLDPKGQFTQLCRMASVANEPWTIFFRPDQGSDRFEVVVELGWPGMVPQHAAPYRAVISRGSQKVAEVNVGEHYWWSRWRWQSAPRQVRATPPELMLAKLAPPVGRALPGQGISRPTSSTYAPMAWSALSLMPYMGSGGERDEIGLITEYQAAWLATGSAITLTAMLNQANAHGSAPVHFRDETMAPISIQRYPRVSAYARPEAAGADPWLNCLEAPIVPEKAHYPSLNYIPFLATGDPYYLEEMQFAAQYHLLEYNTAYRKLDKGILGDEQTRGWAWGIRALFQAVAATPDRVPVWIMPRAYFRTILGNNQAWFKTTQMEDRADPMKSVCHFAIVTAPDHIGPWQQDFLSAVLGWAVLAGFEEWRGAYEWHVQQALTRALGRHGYPRSQAVQYYYKSKGATDWSSLAATSALANTPDGNFPSNTDRSYAAYLRAVLALAMRNQVAGADEAFRYVDGQVRRLGFLPYKWAYDG